MEIHHEHTETKLLATIFGGQLPQPSFFYRTRRATIRVSQACLGERANGLKSSSYSTCQTTDLAGEQLDLLTERAALRSR